MVRDRIVVGIRDAKLSQKLQMDAELSLEKATKLVSVVITRLILIVLTLHHTSIQYATSPFLDLNTKHQIRYSGCLNQTNQIIL